MYIYLVPESIVVSRISDDRGKDRTIKNNLTMNLCRKQNS